MRTSEASEGRSPSLFASESIARGELDAVHAECDGLRRQLVAATDALMVREQQVEELQKQESDEIASLKRLIDTRLEGKAQQTLYLNETTAKLHRRITELEDEVHSLSAQLDQATFGKNALELEAQAMAAKVHGLEKENATLDDALKHQRALTAQVQVELDAARSDAVSQQRSRSEPGDLQAAQHEHAMQVRQLSKALSELEGTLRDACAAAPQLSATVLDAEALNPSTWSWDASSATVTIGAKGHTFIPGVPTVLYVSTREALGGRPVDMPSFASITAGNSRTPADASSTELLVIGYGGLSVRAPRRVAADTWSLETVVEPSAAQSRVGVRLLTCTGALRASRTFPVASQRVPVLGDPSRASDAAQECIGGRIGLAERSWEVDLADALPEVTSCDVCLTPDPVPPGGVVHALLSLRDRTGRVVPVAQADGWEWRVKGAEGVVPRSVTPGPPQQGAVALSFAAAHDVGVAAIAIEVFQTKGRGDMSPPVAPTPPMVMVVEGSVTVRASSTTSMLSDISLRMRGLAGGVGAIAVRLSELDRLVADRTGLLTRTEKDAAALRQALETRSAEGRRDADEAEQQSKQQQRRFATAQMEIDRLTQELANAAESRLVLNATHEAVITELQTVRHQVQAADNGRQACEEQLADAQTQLEVHRAKIAQLNEEHVILLGTSEQKAAQTLASKEDHIASLDERIKLIMHDSVQKSHAHAAELSTLKAAVKDAKDALKMKIERLAAKEEECAEALAEKARLEAEAQTLNEAAAQSGASCEAVRQIATKLEADRDALKAERRELHERITTLEERVRAAQERALRAEAMVEEEKSVFEAERERLEEDLAVKQRTVQSLEVQVASLTEDGGAASTALALHETRLAAVHEELTALRTTHDTLFIEFKQKCEQCDALTASNGELTGQLNDQKNSVIHVTELHSNSVVELTNRLTAKETQLDTLRAKYDGVERDLAVAAAAQERVDSLVVDLQAAQAQNAVLTAESVAVREEKAALETKVQGMQVQLGSIKASLTSAREGILSTEEQKRVFETSIAQLQGEKDEQGEDLNRLQSALTSCEEELHVVSHAASAAAQRLQERTAELEQVRAEYNDDLERSRIDLEQARTAHTGELERARAAHVDELERTRTAHMEELDRAIAAHGDEMGRSQAAYADTEAQLAEKEATIGQLQTQLSARMDELASMNDSKEAAIGQLQTQLSAKMDELESMNSTIAELEQNVACEITRVESANQLRCEREMELQEKEAELYTFRSTATDTVLEVETKYQEISQAHRELQTELERQSSEHVELLHLQRQRTAEEEERARITAEKLVAAMEELAAVRASASAAAQTAKAQHEELIASHEEVEVANARRWEAQERGYEKRIAALENAAEEAEKRCEESREECTRQAAVWQAQLRTLEEASQDDIQRLQALQALAAEDCKSEVEALQTRLANSDAALRAERATAAALEKRTSLSEQLLVITEESAEREQLVVEAVETECTIFRRALSEVRRNLRSVTAEKNTEADEAAHAHSLHKEALRQVEAQRAERDELLTRLRVLETALASRTEEMHLSNRRTCDLDAALADARAAHTTAFQRMQAAHDEHLQGVQVSHEQELATFTESLTGLRESYAATEVSLLAKTRECKDLEERVVALEDKVLVKARGADVKAQEAEEKASECRALLERLAALEAQLQAKGSECAGLEERVLKAARERIEDAERFSAETERLSEELHAMRGEGERAASELEAARGALRQSRDEMHGQHGRLAAERNEMARLEVELDSAHDALRRTRASEVELQAKGRALQEEVARLAADVDDKDREASRLGAALAVAEKELSVLGHVREENRVLLGDAGQLRGRADDLFAAQERLEMQRRALEHQKQSLAEEVEMLTKENQALAVALGAAGRKESLADTQHSVVEGQLRKAEQNEAALRQAFAMEKENLEFDVARLTHDLREEKKYSSFVSAQADYARRALEGHASGAGFPHLSPPPRRSGSSPPYSDLHLSPPRGPTRPHIAALESEHRFVHRITSMEQELLAASLFHSHQLALAQAREVEAVERLAEAEQKLRTRDLEVVRVKEELLLVKNDMSNKEVCESARLQVTSEEMRLLKEAMGKVEEEKRILVGEQHKLISELDAMDVKHKILEAKCADSDDARRGEREARVHSAQLRTQVGELEEELSQLKRNLNDEIKLRIECQETLSSVRGGEDTEFSALSVSKLSETEERVHHLSRMNDTLREERRLDLQNIKELRVELGESREFAKEAEHKMNLAKELVKEWEQSVNATHSKQLQAIKQEAHRSRTKLTEMDHQVKTTARRNDSLQLELQIQRQRAQTAEVALKEATNELAEFRVHSRASGRVSMQKSRPSPRTTTPGRKSQPTPHTKSPSIATHYVSLAEP
eukprot:TRINITY_DN6210_c0_g1_i1.p1 TRINITY_DN6210_c0_g1~~TRINITY_DN6210_c0_g1_i1.p1  ORF type:complete len:2388 (+),score=965.72 TRINITY_DN6210_c0_g1_i1:69-7232(+)